MAKETGWGYRRILGELKKLRIRNISRSTIARILQENGFDPGPKRGEGSWHEFVQRHIKTLWATEFFTTKVWTVRGPVLYHVLFFIHVHTRRVHVVGMTPNPDGQWMAQQARNMSMIFDQGLGNVPITGSLPPPEPLESFQLEGVEMPSTTWRAVEAPRA